MQSISIFGTASDAGKSTLTFVIARLLQQRGISTVPFKAQNVSNNSRVAEDGSEIAISTWFQAEVLGVPRSWHLNPILLKSGSRGRASMIVGGMERGEREVRDYYREIDRLKPTVEEGFAYLQARYACVVAEGAGGCVELNLLDKDLSNTFIAERFNTKIILVADIEKGGVFAQIYGTLHLLGERLRENLIGVVINKFRGDRRLFDEGVRIIEEEFGVPVLGVLPWIPFALGFEDSQSLANYSVNPEAKIRVGVIRLPHISNFTDFEPLMLDGEISVEFVTSSLSQYDLVCLPGSKRVTEDLAWLRRSGLADALKRYEGEIVAICGGYEMLFERIVDEEGIECEEKVTDGLGMIAGEVRFGPEKVVRERTVQFRELSLHGYEIHYARSEGHPDLYHAGRIFGTFLHGLFENDRFRNWLFGKIDRTYRGFCFRQRRDDLIAQFVSTMERALDMERIVAAIEKPQ